MTDIVKLLEQVPGWRALWELPKRLAAAEARVAALEGKAALNAGPAALQGPICREPMLVTAESDHPIFGVTGVKMHTAECAAGHKTTRDYIPGKGYQ
ncbi:MAG TPA: hypothetical protein VME45_03080 [Stellaceae bacterium]|nr:hypothetical protein [Stellaceae bacterium]